MSGEISGVLICCFIIEILRHDLLTFLSLSLSFLRTFSVFCGSGYLFSVSISVVDTNVCTNMDIGVLSAQNKTSNLDPHPYESSLNYSTVLQIYIPQEMLLQAPSMWF